MDLNWTKSQAAEVGVTLLEMPLLAPVARARPKLCSFQVRVNVEVSDCHLLLIITAVRAEWAESRPTFTVAFVESKSTAHYLREMSGVRSSVSAKAVKLSCADKGR